MSSTVREFIPTRRSLLSRLKDWNDQESWKDFFYTYWKLIYKTALKAGLSDAEAQDVVQETVISVFKSMPHFVYDDRKSFKSWLLRLTQWRITDQLRKRRGLPPAGEVPDQLPDPADSPLAKVWDREWELNLVEAAVERVKKKIDAKHFQVFQCSVLKEWPATRVAKALNLSPATVYVIRHRVGKLFQKELASLRSAPV